LYTTKKPVRNIDVADKSRGETTTRVYYTPRSVEFVVVVTTGGKKNERQISARARVNEYK